MAASVVLGERMRLLIAGGDGFARRWRARLTGAAAGSYASPMADTGAPTAANPAAGLTRLEAAVGRIEAALAGRLEAQGRDRDAARAARKEAQAAKAENADLRAANRTFDERLAAAARRLAAIVEG
jgi:hypothetical protein